MNWFQKRLVKAYENGFYDGLGQPGKDYLAKIIERKTNARIRVMIESRVTDLRACHKNDNCQEFASLIESYIPEWLDDEL